MKHAIHCETQEEARQVLQIAHDTGLKWADGSRLINFLSVLARFNIRQGSFCPHLDGEDGVVWCRKETCEKEGCNIVEAQDFIEANKKSKCESTPIDTTLPAIS